jgi:hypothetical protein
MTTANRPPGGGAPVQPWTPGAAPKGVTCPACGLANEAGARTCRNCGLPIAATDDPVRGVAPGRVELPRVRRSGVSATVGFVLVVALLLVGGSLAVTGGGGILGSGGRFFEAEDSPSPTPLIVAGGDIDPNASALPGTGVDEGADVPKAATPNKKDYSCLNEAIKDLSRGSWFMADVQAGLREDEDGNRYDQVYWRLSRKNVGKKVKENKASTVSMQWSTPDKAKERFGTSIGKVQGDTALIITFNGPVDLSTDSSIEQVEFENEGIDQLRRVQLFERNGKVFSVIGIKGQPCARLGSLNWGPKATKKDKARVVIDFERF